MMKLFGLIPVISWVIFLLVGTAAILPSANAFPTGAGSCNPGTTAILSPNLPHATNMQLEGAGSALSFFDFQVLLDGAPMDPDVMQSFLTREPHVIAINATGDQEFRGFLIRMASAQVDTITSLAPLPVEEDGSGFVQVALGTCVNINGVGGITHYNPSRVNVTFVSGILQLNEPADDLVMDITVVMRNSRTEDISLWAFSSYTLTAVAPPTQAPSSSPPTATDPPVAPAPTSSAARTMMMSCVVLVGGFVADYLL